MLPAMHRPAPTSVAGRPSHAQVPPKARHEPFSCCRGFGPGAGTAVPHCSCPGEPGALGGAGADTAPRLGGGSTPTTASARKPRQYFILQHNFISLSACPREQPSEEEEKENKDAAGSVMKRCRSSGLKLKKKSETGGLEVTSRII